MESITGKTPAFYFLFQETREPYACSLIGLPPVYMEFGVDRVRTGLFLWEQCMKSGKWPSYTLKVCWVDLPGYLMTAWQDRQAGMELAYKDKEDAL